MKFWDSFRAIYFMVKQLNYLKICDTIAENGVVLPFLWVYAFGNGGYDMNNAAEIVTIVSSLTAAIFAVTTYLNGVKHDRRQATLDAYNLLQEQALDYLAKYSVDEIKEISKHYSTEEYKIVSSYIARIEHCCVGVNLRIYDKKTVYELAGGFLDEAIYKKIAPMIEKKNFGNNDFYKNTHKVICEMQVKRKGCGGK